MFAKPTRMQTPDTRFEMQYIPEPNTGCWIWIGALCGGDYAAISINRRQHKAHRWNYERNYGPVPVGLVLDHKCRMRMCVNPKHLRAVTQKENVLCGIGIQSVNSRKTHCIHGHPFDAKNTYYWHSKQGIKRECRMCCRDKTRRRRLIKSALDVR